MLARLPPDAIGDPETPTRDVVEPLLARIARLFDVRVAEFCTLDETLRDVDDVVFVPRVPETEREETVLDATPRDTADLLVVGCVVAFVVRDIVDRDNVRLDVDLFERGL